MSSENNKNNFHEIITHWKITRKILYHWCQQFKFIYTVDFTLHFTLHLKHIFFMHLLKYLIFLVFFFTQFLFHFLFIHPLPSPSLYGYLDSGTPDIHRGGHATASYASLSMGNWFRETPSAAFPDQAQSVSSTTRPWRPSTDPCQP